MNMKTLFASGTFRTVVLVLVLSVADLLLSLMSLGLGLDSGTVPEHPEAAEFIRFAGMPVLAPLGAVALIWRHRFPRTVVVIAAIVGALSFSGIAFIVAFYLLAKRRLDWWIAAIAVLALAAEHFLGMEPLGWEELLVGLALLAAIAAWGAYRGQRARLSESRIVSLKERAERAETERAAEAGRSKLAERHRIAREMHDTLAHRMSLVAVQAAALQVDAPDAETASAAQIIRETAHAALGELREVLGVLREDGTIAAPARVAPQDAAWHDVAPVPVAAVRGLSGIEQIAGLLAEWRQAGIVVEYEPLDEPAESAQAIPEIPEETVSAVPNAVSRAAFRVVQEGMTNVARHAPEASAVVTLKVQAHDAAGKELLVVVHNEPGTAGDAAAGAGVGLIGLAERIELLGGELEHGSTETGFTLLARIPFPSANHDDATGTEDAADRAGATDPGKPAGAQA